MKYILWLLAMAGFSAAAAVAWALSMGPGELNNSAPTKWPSPLAAAPPPASQNEVQLPGMLKTLAGQPAADALIQVKSGGIVRWTWTDAQGAFALALPKDPATRAALEIVVVAYEHLPAIFHAESDRLDWTLPAPAPELEALEDLVLGNFTGRVERKHGSPEGLEIWLTPPPGTAPLSGRIERRTRVAPDGTYTFANLTAGVYQARIVPSWAAGGTWPILAAGALPFEPGSSMPAPPALAPVEGAIEGTVTDEDGRALAGALILVQQLGEAQERLWPARASDSSGAFRVDELPPGRYRVELTSGATRLQIEVQVAKDETTPANFQLP